MRTDLNRVVATRGRPCRRGHGLWTAGPVSALLVCALAPAAAAGVRPTLVAAGEAHSCVLTRGGTVLCWGANASGQLGDGSTTQRLTPVAVIGLTNAETSVVAGQSHTCAITTGGGVVCWGENGDGQLGNNSTTDSPTPVQVSGLTSGVTALAGGGNHTCAISGGELKCWGRNTEGQVGIGNYTTPQLTPITVTGMAAGVVAVTAGYTHTCAIVGSGALRCWGAGGNGQLGTGTQTTYNVPVDVSGLGSGVTAVAAGWRTTCALTTGGAAQCWGYNANGQVGIGTTTPNYVLSPMAVVGLSSGVTALAGGRYHTCALTTGGAVLCWGYNGDGELGDGTTVGQLAPVSSNVTIGGATLVAGSRHTCVVTAGGAARCWGLNANGQLGDGSTTNQSMPTVVIGLGGWPPRDVNGDAESDLVWRHATGGDVWLWSMHAGAPASQSYVGTVADAGWAIRGIDDFNGDGKADLLWRHASTGMVYLWLMNGATVLSASYVGVVSTAYDIASVGDYSGDGAADILWRHLASGGVWAWVMDGATIEEAVYITTVDPGYEVVGSGDLNGDGATDIVWRHSTNGEVWTWVMNDSPMPDATLLGAVGDLGFTIKGVADCSGDGKADILWHHATSGDVWLWRMEGAAIAGIMHMATVGDPSYRLVGTADYNGDGRADLLWHHATRGELWVWLMSGASITSATWVATVPDVGYRVIDPR